MSTRCYDTDLNDAAWAWIAPYLPVARSGGRPRTTDLRAALNERVKGRKRHLLVDTLGMVVAWPVGSKPPMCRNDAWGRGCSPAYNPASRGTGR